MMSRGKGKQFFFDKMILYGHEGLKKYSSNEIPKSALGKKHPSAHSLNLVQHCTGQQEEYLIILATEEK